MLGSVSRHAKYPVGSFFLQLLVLSFVARLSSKLLPVPAIPTFLFLYQVHRKTPAFVERPFPFGFWEPGAFPKTSLWPLVLAGSAVKHEQERKQGWGSHFFVSSSEAFSLPFPLQGFEGWLTDELEKLPLRFVRRAWGVLPYLRLPQCQMSLLLRWEAEFSDWILGILDLGWSSIGIEPTLCKIYPSGCGNVYFKPGHLSWDAAK